MFEHARRRRGEDEALPPEASPPAPPAASTLALQSTAGNRAVVQRLMHDRTKGELVVPAAFASQKARWNDELKHVDATSAERSLFDLWPNHAVRDALQTSLGVDWLQDLRPVAEPELEAEAKTLAEDEKDEALTKALGTSAVSHTRLMFNDAAPFNQQKLLDNFTFIPAFHDLFPEKPDLAAAGQSVRSEIPGTADEHGKLKKYWEYTCVLIALYKNDGIAKVNQILGDRGPVEDDIDVVVQALHDFYIGRKIQYDDTATRMTVMNEWGYQLVFGGNVAWADLPLHVALYPSGKYIVDIDGHTVKMKPKHRIPRATTPLQGLMIDHFECDSDKENYSTSEFLKPVLYVWKAR